MKLHNAGVQPGHAQQGVHQPIQTFQLPLQLPACPLPLLCRKRWIGQLCPQKIQGGQGRSDLMGDIGQKGSELFLILL